MTKAARYRCAIEQRAHSSVHATLAHGGPCVRTCALCLRELAPGWGASGVHLVYRKAVLLVYAVVRALTALNGTVKPYCDVSHMRHVTTPKPEGVRALESRRSKVEARTVPARHSRQTSSFQASSSL